MKRKEIPPKSVLDSFLSYNPKTGVFRHLRCHQSIKAGDEAGYIDRWGYRVLKINCERYKAHRVAFSIMGLDVPDFVDHINHDRSDNRWSNIRPSTHMQNSRNRSLQKSNKLGVNGVRKASKCNNYEAFIYDNNKYIHLGSFKTVELAAAARKKAESALGYDKNHGLDLGVSNVSV